MISSSASHLRICVYLNRFRSTEHIFLCTFFLCYSPAEKFDPDRFLPEEVDKRSSFSYLPFGLGPKQYIGIRIALLELKIGLMKILQRFKFERGAGTTEKLELQSGIILTFLKPMFVKLVKRSRDE